MPRVSAEASLPLLDEVAKVAAERDAAAAALIGLTHRAAEAGATATDIAGAAGVSRNTIYNWAVLPAVGDTVDAVEMQRRAIGVLGGVPEGESLDELVAQRQALIAGREGGLGFEGNLVVGAAILSARLAAGADSTVVVLGPRGGEQA